jgi:hypothetical protein
VVVENLQLILGALLSPSDGAGVCFVAAALVVRKELRIDQAVTKVAVELGIEPVHHLVDLGPLFQVFRVGRQPAEKRNRRAVVAAEKRNSLQPAAAPYAWGGGP